MCNLYRLGKDGYAVAQHFGLGAVPVLAARAVIAPTEATLVIRAGNGGVEREAAWLRWGLIPSWAKPEMASRPLTNARVETLAEKPAFRDAFRSRRCLIPADGFYEWSAAQEAGAGPESARKGKRRRWLIRRDDDSLFAFAGLWETWRVPESQHHAAAAPGGQVSLGFARQPTPVGKSSTPGRESQVVRLIPGQIVATCTIITTAAQPWLAPLHDRMPLVLPHSLYADWLDPHPRSASACATLLAHAPERGWAIEDGRPCQNSALNR